MASMSLPSVEKAQGLRLFWYTMWARAYPRIIGTMREPSWAFFEMLLPLLGTVSFVYVYRALEAPEAYIGFVVVGGAMTAFWLNVLWAMASQLYWDKDAGNLELYVVSPAPLMGILLGMAVGGLVWTTSRAFTILLVASMLFEVNYSLAQLPLVGLIFFLTMAALYGMGMLFASVFLVAGREAWHISNLLQEPVYLVSGFYFPVKTMGNVIATFASIIPLTLGLDAMRQLLFPSEEASGFLNVWVEAGIMAVMAVVFIAIAWYALKRLEEVGRREGRLIERRR
jgi:ABC-2 type transport system permease protein